MKTITIALILSTLLLLALAGCNGAADSPEKDDARVPFESFYKQELPSRMWVAIGADAENHAGDRVQDGEAFRLELIGEDVHLVPIGALKQRWKAKYDIESIRMVQVVSEANVEILCAEAGLEHKMPPPPTIQPHIIRLQKHPIDPNKMIMTFGDKSVGETCISGETHGGTVHFYS